MSRLLDDVNSTLRHTWPSNFEILTVETLQTTFDRSASRRSSSSSSSSRQHPSTSPLTTTGLRIFLGFFDSPPTPPAFELFLQQQQPPSSSQLRGAVDVEEHAGQRVAVGNQKQQQQQQQQLAHHVCETIGLADFAPALRQDGTMETFSELVSRASARCSTRFVSSLYYPHAPIRTIMFV